MNKMFLVVSMLAAGALSAQAQQQQVPAQQTTADSAKVLFSEDLLLRSVVLLKVKIAGSGAIYSGTGFLVAMPDPRLPVGAGFTYLVTNRHIAEAVFKDGDDSCKAHPISQVTVTFNLKTDPTGNRTREGILDVAAAGGWVLPSDPGIDLAVLPLGFDQLADVTYIGTEIFVNPERWTKFAVTLGDKLLTTGFFQHYAGTHQFQPIVREGSLAMVPDDRMGGVLCNPAKVYLADVHIIPGNSGSPIFVGVKAFLGGLVRPGDGGSPYLLLGVVSGYMYEDLALDLRPASDFDKIVHSNSGIAVVVPAEQLMDLLSVPRLQQLRNSRFAAQPNN